LPDFPWYNIPNWGKIYQITIKYSKRPQNITYGLKIDQMNINIPTNIGNYNTLENLPKLGFLVLKIYHLATLASCMTCMFSLSPPFLQFARRSFLINTLAEKNLFSSPQKNKDEKKLRVFSAWSKSVHFFRQELR
jgi:hypothetical protein